MTPAIKLAEREAIAHRVHAYTHDPAAESYGLEAAEALGLPPQRVFKTLVASLEGARAQLVVAVLPVDRQLDLKALASAAGAKRAQMAPAVEAERATGYVLGGISPLGQKRRLPLYLDVSAEPQATIYVSAGRRGLEIELAPADLLRLTGGRYAQLGR